MTWITATDVVAEAGSPTPSTLGFADAAAMNNHITNFVVPGTQGLIEQHLRRTYTDAMVPAAVKYAALRVAATALLKIGIRKMSSLVRVEDWRVEISRQDIFTPEIRAELEPFEKRKSYTKRSDYQSDDIKDTWLET